MHVFISTNDLASLLADHVGVRKKSTVMSFRYDSSKDGMPILKGVDVCGQQKEEWFDSEPKEKQESPEKVDTDNERTVHFARIGQSVLIGHDKEDAQMYTRIAAIAVCALREALAIEKEEDKSDCGCTGCCR